MAAALIPAVSAAAPLAVDTGHLRRVDLQAARRAEMVFAGVAKPQHLARLIARYVVRDLHHLVDVSAVA